MSSFFRLFVGFFFTLSLWMYTSGHLSKAIRAKLQVTFHCFLSTLLYKLIILCNGSKILLSSYYLFFHFGFPRFVYLQLLICNFVSLYTFSHDKNICKLSTAIFYCLYNASFLKDHKALVLLSSLTLNFFLNLKRWLERPLSH